MKLKKALDRIPGGLILVPLLLGACVHTFAPGAGKYFGSFTNGLITGTVPILATAVAANDLLGVTTGGMQQTLQRFAPTSTEAASLLGKAWTSTNVVGLGLASIPIYTALATFATTR